MSLYLTIKQVINLKLQGQMKIEQKLSLVIQNSKSGALLIEKVKFNRLRWEQKFQFTTSIEDNVEFILKKGDQKQSQLKDNILGRGKLFTKKFVRMFEKEILSNQSKNQSFQYQITLFKQSDEDEIKVGTVQLEITMDKSKKYEGQIIYNSDLDLRGQKHSNPKFVKFYLGKTSKINLFNLFDEKADNPKCRFLQSIYKDLQ